MSGRLAAELTGPAADSPLTAMTAARDLAAVSQAALQQSVDRARRAGYSWREIGDVLQTTRQAAFQRFGRPVDPRTGTAMPREVPAGRAEQAVALFTDLTEGRFGAACRDFTPQLRSQVNVERVGRAYLQLVGTIGEFEWMGSPQAIQLDDLTMVRVPLHFEAGERTGQVSIDASGSVVGLFFRPGGETA